MLIHFHRAAILTLLAAAALAYGQTPTPSGPRAPAATPTVVPTPAPQPTPQPPKPEVETKKPPTGQVIFFQLLVHDGLVGTGFFVKATKGETIGATSIHFLDLDGPPLERVEWLGGPDLIAIATATKAFGQPGVQPKEGRDDDYHDDYLLLALEAPPTVGTPLELDDRKMPRAKTAKAAGERVWFPILDGRVKPDGVRWINGEIVSASSRVIHVQLDEAIKLQGASGTPVVSQETGKVIGVTSAATVGAAKPTVLLAPARGIWQAMTKAESSGERPVLKSIDWSKHGIVRPKPAKTPTPKGPKKPTNPDDDKDD